jgi:Staphylococcal nuclease homologue
VIFPDSQRTRLRASLRACAGCPLWSASRSLVLLRDWRKQPARSCASPLVSGQSTATPTSCCWKAFPFLLRWAGAAGQCRHARDGAAGALPRGAGAGRARRRWKLDKYRRALAYVTIDGEDLGELLVREGLARRYHGERRLGWCR